MIVFSWACWKMLFYCLTVQPCLLAVVVVAVVAVVVVVVVVGGGGGGGGGGIDRKIPTDSHYPLMDIYLIKHLQRVYKAFCSTRTNKHRTR